MHRAETCNHKCRVVSDQAWCQSYDTVCARLSRKPLDSSACGSHPNFASAGGSAAAASAAGSAASAAAGEFCEEGLRCTRQHICVRAQEHTPGWHRTQQ